MCVIVLPGGNVYTTVIFIRLDNKPSKVTGMIKRKKTKYKEPGIIFSLYNAVVTCEIKLF